MNYNSIGSFEYGFDEETDKTIDTRECPVCGGVVRSDGGEIDCRSCGVVLNEYARTGRLVGHSGTEIRSRVEVA